MWLTFSHAKANRRSSLFGYPLPGPPHPFAVLPRLSRSLHVPSSPHRPYPIACFATHPSDTGPISIHS
jgi:hypothetical protein